MLVENSRRCYYLTGSTRRRKRYKLRFAWRIQISGTNRIRATCSPVLQDTDHNLVGIGGRNWTLNNDTVKQFCNKTVTVTCSMPFSLSIKAASTTSRALEKEAGCSQPGRQDTCWSCPIGLHYVFQLRAKEEKEEWKFKKKNKCWCYNISQLSGKTSCTKSQLRTVVSCQWGSKGGEGQRSFLYSKKAQGLSYRSI